MAFNDIKKLKEILELGIKNSSNVFVVGHNNPDFDSIGSSIGLARLVKEYNLTLDEVKAACEKFVGEINQTVPIFSAVKINGERAYKLARKGKEVEMPTRQVTVFSIDILDYTYPELKIRTHVSSGTYIRTLGEDIGKALGTGAYLTALRRTKIANYDVADALKLDDFMI